MQDFLVGLPGVSNVEDNLQDGPREYRLVIDQARASQHGLQFEELARALENADPETAVALTEVFQVADVVAEEDAGDQESEEEDGSDGGAAATAEPNVAAIVAEYAERNHPIWS